MNPCPTPSRIKFAASGHLLRVDVIRSQGTLRCVLCGWSVSVGTIRGCVHGDNEPDQLER